MARHYRQKLDQRKGRPSTPVHLAVDRELIGSGTGFKHADVIFQTKEFYTQSLCE